MSISFKIPYNMMVDKVRYERFFIDILNLECLCTHKAIAHQSMEYRNVNEMSEEYVFTRCRISCKCTVFTPDNLKYLEMMLRERSSV